MLRLCLQTGPPCPPTSMVLKLILSEMLRLARLSRPRDQTRSGRGCPATSHSRTVWPASSSARVSPVLTSLGLTATEHCEVRWGGGGGGSDTYRAQWGGWLRELGVPRRCWQSRCSRRHWPDWPEPPPGSFPHSQPRLWAGRLTCTSADWGPAPPALHTADWRSPPRPPPPPPARTPRWRPPPPSGCAPPPAPAPPGWSPGRRTPRCRCESAGRCGGCPGGHWVWGPGTAGSARWRERCSLASTPPARPRPLQQRGRQSADYTLRLLIINIFMALWWSHSYSNVFLFWNPSLTSRPGFELYQS